MTREEATAWFKVLLKDEYAFNSADREAFAMAIKALEHPERNVVAIVPCGDAISRQAVLDKKELVELEDGQSFYCISPEDVETLPPVNPQVKTGHWIRFKEFENGYYHIKCSECGQYWSIDGHAKIFRYCFNCGAKMIEPQESEG